MIDFSKAQVNEGEVDEGYMHVFSVHFGRYLDSSKI